MNIVFAVFGSLGDMHPAISVGLELKRRGHSVTIAAMEFYREKIEMLGFEFRPMRPHFHPEDRDLARQLMDTAKGSETIVRELLIPNLRPMYEDLMEIVAGSDVLVSTDVVLAARSVAEKTGVKWATTTLAPGTFLSAYDPFVPPIALWLRHLRFLPRFFHQAVFREARRQVDSWFAPYREFRRSIGLEEGPSPLVDGRSESLNLAMFSRHFASPQPDWPRATLQTGFCFYDGEADVGAMDPELEAFLDSGEPPIVFTLGSAAVMDARDFFEVSAAAAKSLGRRAVLLYGVFNEPPQARDEGIAAFPYAPYSKVFSRAACVAHQGGIGTTSQVLLAGVPHLVMPFAHDQPDNAFRLERLGVAKTIMRGQYDAANAASKIKAVLDDPSIRSKAVSIASEIRKENGASVAADALEGLATASKQSAD